MVDGNIEVGLSLKSIANELAEQVGTVDTMYFDELNKTYFIDGVTEENLLDNDFKLFSKTSNEKPIYRRENIYAEPNTDPAFGNVMLYKNNGSRLRGDE